MLLMLIFTFTISLLLQVDAYLHFFYICLKKKELLVSRSLSETIYITFFQYTQSVSIIRTHPFISENFQKVRYIENSDISRINSLYYYNNPFWISIPVYRDFTYCPNYRRSELSRPTVYIIMSIYFIIK